MQASNIPELLVIASNNQHKMAEFRQILGTRIELKTMAEVLQSELEIAETATTFQGNALIKALTAYKATKLPSLADDSGICVRGLNMAPGIYSARYAGMGASDQENRQKLLAACKDLSGADLDAWFCCALCYIDANGISRIFSGQVQGRIQVREQGEGGFGYDPIFYLPERGKTMAELSDAEKNQISHRARAAEKLTQFFGLIAQNQHTKTKG